MPRKLRHCQGYSGMRWIFATKLRYSATVTCADSHGWPRRGDYVPRTYWRVTAVVPHRT